MFRGGRYQKLNYKATMNNELRPTQKDKEMLFLQHFFKMFVAEMQKKKKKEQN